MGKFTVEEVNLMCVFEGQDRKGMIADIKNVIPHIHIEEPSSPCIKMCFVLLSLMSFKNASRLAGVLKSAEKF